MGALLQRPAHHHITTHGDLNGAPLRAGWKLFGSEDRVIGHGRGREGHKAERWGKKYQWMAYHELLARVADNHQASRRFGDSGMYEGRLLPVPCSSATATATNGWCSKAS